MVLSAAAHAAQPPAWPSQETRAEQQARIALWPGDGLAPGDRPLADAQRVFERSRDPVVPDRYVDRVGRPYLVVQRPAHPNGAALLVIPGGGYARIVLDKEGTALAPAFAGRGGITLFVLRYRLPGEGHADGADAPLADAQRALRVIRAQARQWGLDPHRIGVMGFSAGGHLAASLATRYGDALHAPVDAIDRASARPDFQLLVYPVIDMAGPDAHAGSRRQLLGDAPAPERAMAYSPQRHVDARTPPAFLVHAQDDDVVPVQNSLSMYDALRAADVPVEMHLFPRGGHGFGVRGTNGLTAEAWPTLALAWIDTQREVSP
ncbi:alpha/beta hydrolase [Stenotrophomonas sp. HITSZ_GD]|uniref:alpha/beta hydrolase n=1 Tax=Stenotrophomonas sp. HITSZ_GD TaxID=3037248 RepID=UPI00240E67AD|nr:alpha/beta hydrolase [Stenotrophomonas sp. HITSZ_GD]MDG2523985.1 alpha/beta hydrolase [Stenotrophomonas sp. HITSZ_GD]